MPYYPHRLTDEQRVDAVRRVLAGESRSHVARTLGVTPQAIQKLVASRANEGRLKQTHLRARKLTDEQRIEAVRRYQDGESTIEIARAFGVKPQGIHGLLLRRGIELRPQPGRPRMDPKLKRLLRQLEQLAPAP